MDITTLRNNRLKASAIAISGYLKEFTVDDLIFNLYLPIKDEETKTLIKFYEQELILCKLDEKRYIKERPKMIKKVKDWVYKHKHWTLFSDFLMYVQRNLEKKPHNILYAYLTSLIDTWTILAPFGRYWYGIDDNKPLFVKELYGNYDEPMYELGDKLEKAKNVEQHNKIVQQIIELEIKIRPMQLNERNIMNIVFSMVGLINANNQDLIFPKNWADHHWIVKDIPRQIHTTEFYLDLLDQRNYLLATEGVVIKCFNSGYHFKELRLKEEFLEDGMILLFNYKNIEDKESMGFIDLRDKYYYCVGQYATEYNICNIKDSIINFILEVYTYLTCEYDSKALIEFVKEKDIQLHPTSDPAIYCETYDIEHRDTPGGSRKHTQKIMHKVRPFTRKGNPSEMAKANARLYGIVLPQGMTFVTEHIRGAKKGIM